jgi:hypothetical protein
MIRFTRPTPRHTAVIQSTAYRYGMLAVILILYALNLWQLFYNSPDSGHDRYNGLVVTTILFLNHLASAFPWRPAIGRWLFYLVFSWVAFAFYHLCR